MSAAQPDRAAAGRRVDARSRFDDATHARKRRTHYPTPVVVTILRPLWSRWSPVSQGLCIDADARLDLANFFAATKDCHVRQKS